MTRETTRRLEETFSNYEVDEYPNFGFSPGKIVWALKKCLALHHQTVVVVQPPLSYFKWLLLCPLFLLSRGKIKTVWINDGEPVKFGIGRFLWVLFLFIPVILLNLFILLGWTALVVLMRFFFSRPPKPRESEDSRKVACLYPQYYIVDKPVGGHIAHVKGMVDSLTELGWDPLIFAQGKIRGVEAKYHLLTVMFRDYTTLTTSRMLYGVTLGFFAAKIIRKKKIAFIYQRHEKFDLSGCLVSIITGYPLLLESNAILAYEADKSKGRDSLAFLLKFGERATFGVSHRISAISAFLKEDIEKMGIPGKRIFANPNGVDTKIFNPNCGGKKVRNDLGLEDRIVVGFCGTFQIWHGLKTIRETALKVLSEFDNSAFLFIGDGPGRESLEQEITGKFGPQRGIFTGRISHEMIPGYLDACDVLISALGGEHKYASPTKMFEYMAVAKAIVCYDVGQMSQVFTSEKNALTVADGDHEEFSIAVCRLARDEKLRRKLGNQAEKDVRASYTWQANVERILDSYRTIFDKSPAGGGEKS